MAKFRYRLLAGVHYTKDSQGNVVKYSKGDVIETDKKLDEFNTASSMLRKKYERILTRSKKKKVLVKTKTEDEQEEELEEYEDEEEEMQEYEEETDEDDEDDEDMQLQYMTVAELITVAKKHKIPLGKTKNRDKIIQIIKEYFEKE